MIKGSRLTIEHRRKISVANTGHPTLEVTRKRISNALKGRPSPCKGRVHSKEWKEKMRIGMIGKNKGKKTQEQIHRSLSKSSQRPNNFEVRCFQYLEKIYPGRFKYVGDASIMVCGRSCDFIDIENRIAVLCNGVHWHLRRRGLPIIDFCKRLREEIESTPFVRVGYKVIFLWEDEI